MIALSSLLIATADAVQLLVSADCTTDIRRSSIVGLVEVDFHFQLNTILPKGTSPTISSSPASSFSSSFSSNETAFPMPRRLLSKTASTKDGFIDRLFCKTRSSASLWSGYRRGLSRRVGQAIFADGRVMSEAGLQMISYLSHSLNCTLLRSQ